GDAGAGAGFDALPRFGHRQRQRLLSEYAAKVLVGLHDLADQGRLQVGRHGDVQNFDGRIGEEGIDAIVDFGDLVLLGGGAGMLDIARGDGYGIETGLTVGNQVAIAHNEAGAEAADAKVLAARQLRQILEGEINGHGRPRRKAIAVLSSPYSGPAGPTAKEI